MKAKEYAEKFLEERIRLGIDQATLNVYEEMFTEVGEIGKARNATSNSSLIAIFREQSMKWKAICKIVNPHIISDSIKLEPDGFMRLAEKDMGIKLDV